MQQLGKNAKLCTRWLLTIGFVPASIYTYHLITDHMNRRLPLTEQTLLNFITENGGQELIRKGPVKIDHLECNVNQYKRHADIRMLLETPSNGNYKYRAEYVNVKGVWRLVNSNTTPLVDPLMNGKGMDWIRQLRDKFGFFPNQQST